MAIAGKEPDIILVTEAIPKAKVLPIETALLAIPGYYVITSFNPEERNLGRSGNLGVCVPIL